MFKCQNEECGITVEARQPVNYVITEQRSKVYEKPIKNWKGKVVDYEPVNGSEIVKQIQVCPKCYAKMTGLEPRMVAPQEKTAPRKQGFNTHPTKKRKSNYKGGNRTKPVVERVGSASGPSVASKSC